MNTRLRVFAGFLLLAILLAGITTYAYGLLYSHDRYWNGTIVRVQDGQAALIRSLLLATARDAQIDLAPEALGAMFAPMDGRLIIEVERNGGKLFSNFNGRFERGAEIETVEIAGGVKVVISRYRPPTWNRTFLRWVKAPFQWLSPSYDYVTVPFMWFSAMYFMGLMLLGFAVKAAYLEHDVMAALRKYHDGDDR